MAESEQATKSSGWGDLIHDAVVSFLLLRDLLDTS